MISRCTCLLLVLLTGSTQALFAQQVKSPHIGYIYPSGGQRGTTFEVVVGGQFLEGTTDLLIGGEAIHATVLSIERPIPPRRLNELRDYLKEALKKMADPNVPPDSKKLYPKGPGKIPIILKEAGASDEEIKKFQEMRRQRSDPKRQQNLQISETVTLKMEIGKEAECGPHEIRLLKPGGISNPLQFCVGELPEHVSESSDDKKTAPLTQVVLPVVLNGQIFPGETNHYQFQATKGTHLVIAAQGRDLLPFLADAVPGWFQPALTLYDPKGKTACFADHFYFNTDPVMCYDVPDDGLYRLEVRDLLYRGREDFIYRITIGGVRFVKSIFPLGGPRGTPTTVSVSGWNLSSEKITITPEGIEGVNIIPQLSNGFVTQNVLFADDNLPECMEVEPNNRPDQAQHVTLPVIINGRIDTPGDTDVFAVTCRAGEKIVAEVNARRLNSPLDSWLKITDEKGQQLAFCDDCEDKESDFLTHGADSYLMFTAPATGLYYVHLGDAQGMGGPEYAYRLRLSAPRPDFSLYVSPSGIVGHAGSSVPVTVHVQRKDGFTGEVSLALKKAPAGFVLDGGKIPAGQDKMRLTITFPQTQPEKLQYLSLVGHALIEDRDTSRPVKPADDMIQAFVYHHLVSANELIAVDTGLKFNSAPVKITGTLPVRLRPGGSARIKLTQGRFAPFAAADTGFQLNDPPDGISISDISKKAAATDLTFMADAAKAKPGLKGNLIIETFIERTPANNNGKPAEKRRIPTGFLPAIPFEVIE